MSMALSLAAAAALAGGMLPAAAQTPAPESPYAGYEARVLPNGLRVWFKRVPGMRDVSVSIVVPYGRDRDPVGREQLAHFTEHVLFADRHGRTEEEIKTEVESRGGTRNGMTFADRTFYFIRVERQHALFAIEWQCGIVEPREVSEALVVRQRDPVLLELRARPRGVPEWLVAHLIDPPRLRLPDFWKREFGIDGVGSRDVDHWGSIHAITASDVRDFYATHYVPSRMTLHVVGDVEPALAWSTIQRTCGTLPAASPPPPAPPLVDPGRERRMHLFRFGNGAEYSERFKVYGATADEQLRLEFVARYLSQRLAQRLRFGERKAVYGINASVERRGLASVLTVASPRIKSEELAFAREAIGDEIERLRTGTMPDSEFVATRDAVSFQARSRASSAAAMDVWMREVLYDPDTHDRFPDIVAAMSSYQRADIAAFAWTLLAPERRVLSITRDVPLPPAAAVIAAALVWWGALAAARRLLITSLPMTRLRYVARIRRAAVVRLLLWLSLAAGVLVGLRLLAWLFMLLWSAAIAPVDSFALHAAFFALALACAALFLVSAVAIVPAKLLVFDTGIAVKMCAYRSRWIAAGDIATVALLPGKWRGMSPAVVVTRTDGRTISVRSRDSAELHAVLARMVGDAPGVPGG